MKGRREKNLDEDECISEVVYFLKWSREKNLLKRRRRRRANYPYSSFLDGILQKLNCILSYGIGKVITFGPRHQDAYIYCMLYLLIPWD